MLTYTIEQIVKDTAPDRGIILGQLLAATQEGFWHIDTDTRTIDVNPAMCRILGREREEIIGKTIYDFVDAENAAVFRDEIARRRLGHAGTYEISLCRPDGSTVPCINNATAILDPKGNRIASIGLWTDISELKRQRRELEAAKREADEARRLLEAVLDAAPVTIQVKDRDLRVCWANRAYHEHVASVTDSPVGKTLAEVTPNPGMLDEVIAADRTVFATGRPLEQLQQHFPSTGDRSERHLKVTKVPIRDASGEVAQVLTIGADVTELNRLRIEADDARRRLQTVLDAVPVGIQVKGTDGRFRWVNRFFEQTYGVDASAIVGKRVHELSNDPAATEEAARHDRLVLSTGEPVGPYESDFHSSAGEWHRILVSKVPMRDVHGRVTDIMTVGVDISARTRAEAELQRLNDELERRVEQRTAALKDSEERLRDFVEAASDWLWEVDAEFRIAMLSERVEVVTGRPNRMFLGKSMAEIGFRQPDEVASARMRGILDARRPFKDVLSIWPRPDGGHRYFRISGKPMLAASGAFLGYRGTASDVTSEVEANQALKAVADAVPVFLSVKDAAGRFVMLNRTAAAFFGRSPDQMVARQVTDILPDATGNAIAGRDRQVLETRAPLAPCMDRLIGPDGRERDWVSTKTPHLNADGSVRWIITAATDVTELVAARRNALMAREQLRDAIDSLPEGVALFDAAERLVLSNRRIREMNPLFATADGVGLADIVETASRDRYFAAGFCETADDVERRLACLRACGPATDVPFRDNRWLRSETRRTSDGGLVMVVADITAHRRAEDTLRQSQKMQAVGQLTGGMAHDFNNLLGVIIGHLDLLSERLSADAQATTQIAMMIEAAERGASLIQRLLAFSRQQTLAPQECDPRLLIDGTVALLRRTLGEAIAIEAPAPGAPMRCVVDPAQLETALLNLALNSRDAMPHGGSIGIEIARDRIEAGQFPEAPELAAGAYARISISDTGTGMPAEVLARCFDPFFTTKEVGKGSGLGLSMVYGFIRQSGGHATARSEPGHGTTFDLYLPLGAEAAEAVAGAAASASPGGNAELVLVVEDNAAVRESVVATIRSLGYRTVEAEDAETGLAALHANPDLALLFTDIIMPGGRTGVDLANAAREARPGLKVLLTSGYSGEVLDGRDALEAPHEVLAKPYRKAELANRLARLLDRGRGRHDATHPGNR